MTKNGQKWLKMNPAVSRGSCNALRDQITDTTGTRDRQELPNNGWWLPMAAIAAILGEKKRRRR